MGNKTRRVEGNNRPGELGSGTKYDISMDEFDKHSKLIPMQ